MNSMTKLVRPAALCVALLGLAACDITNPLEDVDLILDIDSAPVAIPASLGTIQVSPNSPRANSGTATNDSDIDHIEELHSITIKPSFLTFTPASASANGNGARMAAAEQDGTIRIFLFLGLVPVPGTPVVVTVQNGAVTDVDPQEIQIGSATIDAASVSSFIESLPADSRPELDGWQSMTVDEVVDQINASLASGTIPFAFGVETTGDLSGTLRLSELEFDAQVALSDG